MKKVKVRKVHQNNTNIPIELKGSESEYRDVKCIPETLRVTQKCISLVCCRCRYICAKEDVRKKIQILKTQSPRSFHDAD